MSKVFDAATCSHAVRLIPRRFASASIRASNGWSNRILTTALGASSATGAGLLVPAPDMNASAFRSDAGSFTLRGILIAIVSLLCVECIYNRWKLVDRFRVPWALFRDRQHIAKGVRKRLALHDDARQRLDAVHALERLRGVVIVAPALVSEARQVARFPARPLVSSRTCLNFASAGRGALVVFPTAALDFKPLFLAFRVSQWWEHGERRSDACALFRGGRDREGRGEKMALLGYTFAFLVLLGVVAWIVFPGLMRRAFIARSPCSSASRG